MKFWIPMWDNTVKLVPALLTTAHMPVTKSTERRYTNLCIWDSVPALKKILIPSPSLRVMPLGTPLDSHFPSAVWWTAAHATLSFQKTGYSAKKADLESNPLYKEYRSIVPCLEASHKDRNQGTLKSEIQILESPCRSPGLKPIQRVSCQKED